jgi:hypothetical protein
VTGRTPEIGGVFELERVLLTALTRGSLAPNQVGLTECVLSDIAENAASFSYQPDDDGYAR